MNKFKAIINKIKYPKGWALILFYVLTIIIISTTITLLCLGFTEKFYSYILYVLSFICLTYFIYTIIYFVPKTKANIIKWANKYEFTNNLLRNYGFRTVIFSTFTFTFNTLYALFQTIMAISTLSIWYGALATYYIILSTMRGGTIVNNKRSKNRKSDYYLLESKKLKNYRNCGILLIVLILTFSIAIVQMVVANQGFAHPGLMIYAFAFYAFYKITLAIINIVKAQKQEDVVVKCLRNINMADALISILALQTAMFQEFSPNSPLNSKFNAITGAVVSILTLSLGIYMIINAKQKLNKINNIKFLESQNDDEKVNE